MSKNLLALLLPILSIDATAVDINNSTLALIGVSSGVVVPTLGTPNLSMSLVAGVNNSFSTNLSLNGTANMQISQMTVTSPNIWRMKGVITGDSIPFTVVASEPINFTGTVLSNWNSDIETVVVMGGGLNGYNTVQIGRDGLTIPLTITPQYRMNNLVDSYQENLIFTISY